MSGKASPADPAEYIKKPQPEDAAKNGAAPEEEPEPVRFSPDEEAVSSADKTISIHNSGLCSLPDKHAQCRSS